LIQLVCKRFLETGALEEAIEHVATDRMVSYFFSVDFEMLSESEGEVVRTIARQSPVASDALKEELSLDRDTLEGGLRRLENLGYLHRQEGQGYGLANYFFRRWLQQTENGTVPITSPALAAPAAVGAVSASEPDDPSPGLFAELKRRSVFRVGIVYVIVAWLLLQVGEITFGFLEIPNWAGKLLIVLLGLGLPVALILAWAFELTPEGVKRDRDVERTRS
jgi:predicted transcriptional regulator